MSNLLVPCTSINSSFQPHGFKHKEPSLDSASANGIAGERANTEVHLASSS